MIKFRQINKDITPEQVDMIKGVCTEFGLSGDFNIGRSHSKKTFLVNNINGETLIAINKAGKITTINKKAKKYKVFTLEKVKSAEKLIKNAVKDFYNVEITVTPDGCSLMIKATPKVNFLKKQVWIFGINENISVNTGNIPVKNKDEIIGLINKAKLSVDVIDRTYYSPQEAALIEPKNVCFKISKKKPCIVINNTDFPYKDFFSKDNVLIKDKKFTDLKKKIKLYPKYKEVIEYCKNNSLQTQYSNTSKSPTLITVKYKNSKTKIDFSEPYKKKIKDFISLIDAVGKAKEDLLAQEFSQSYSFGKIISVAVCRILLNGVNGTEASIIKLLRGLSISTEMRMFSKDKLRDNPFIGQFNGMASDYISNTIRSLISDGIIEEKDTFGTFGSFTSLRKNEKTKIFVDYILTHDFEENEFTIIKKILKEKNPLPVLLKHPACYFYSKEVQGKVNDIDDKTRKLIEALYKIEEDKSVKKMLKAIIEKR